MCVLKADFQNCRTPLAQDFFTSSKREREGRGGCSGNLLLDTPAKIVLESAFYDAPACALRQQNVLMCEIRRHWRLFAVASRANSSSRLKVCNAICWLFRFAAPEQAKMGEVGVVLLLGVWSTHSRKVNNCKV